MAKRKMNLDKDSIQKFFVLHGEKLGMAVVLGLMGYFVYSGMQVEGLDESQSPQSLIELATRKQNQVDSTTFESFATVRSAKANLLEEIEAGAVMDPSSYIVTQNSEQPMKPKTLRNDPALRVATDPHVVGAYAAVALNGNNNFQEAILKLPFAPKPDAGRTSSRDDSDADSGFSPGFPGIPGSFPGGSSSGSGSSRGSGGSGGSRGSGRSSGSSGSSGFPGFPGGEGSSGPGASSLGLPGFAAGSPAASAGRMVPMVQQNEMVGVAGRVPVNTRLYNTYVVSVSYLFPHKVQWNEFETTFKEAYGYSPSRDMPRYLKLEVERSEDGGPWESITDRINRYPNSYAVQVVDVVDPKSVDAALTLPIPPTLVESPFELGAHPGVSLRNFSATGDSDEGEGEEGEEGSGDDDDDIFASSRGTGSSSSPFGSMPGGSMPGGSGPGSMMLRGMMPPTSSSGGQGSSMMMGPGGRMGAGAAALKPESDYKLIRFFDLETKPGKAYKYRVRVWLADPNQQDDSAPSTSGGAASVAGGPSVPLPGGPTGVSAGGVGASEGPAGGGSSASASGPGGASATGPGMMQGSMATVTPVNPTDLDPAVRRRVREWRESAEFAALAEAKAEWRFGRPTEWSEETAEFTVPEPGVAEFFAGPAQPIDYSEAAGVRYTNDEPSAALVVSQFDQTLGTRLPAKRDVLRGSWLSFLQNSEFLSPIDMSVRTLGTPADPSDSKSEDEIEPAEFLTDSFVVDVQGGYTISVGRSTKIITGAEVLLVDGDGNFRIADEFDDVMQYRHSLFEEDEETVGGPAMSSGGAGPGGFPGMSIPGSGAGSGPGGASANPGYGGAGSFPGSGPGGGVPGSFPGSGPGGRPPRGR